MCTRFAILMLAAVLLIGCSFSASFSFFTGSAEREFTFTHPSADADSIEINWPDGDVTVRLVSGGTSIMIEGVTTALAEDDLHAEDALDRAEPELSAAAESPRRLILSYDDSRILDASVSADVEVSIPDGIDLTITAESADVTVRGNSGITFVSTRNGRVTVVSQSGDSEIETGNGLIEVESLAGSVSAITENGFVRVTAAPLSGDTVFIQTDGGSIDLLVPADTAADLMLHSSARLLDFDLEAFTVTELQVGFSRVEAVLNGGGATISADTIGGVVSFGSL